MAGKTYDLEDRLLEYAAQIISVTEKLKNTRAACHVGDQLLRAGTSPYFNHGEAESAESQKDFIHKLKICLKELRESWRALRLVRKCALCGDAALVDAALAETDELIRIFVASVRTSQQKVVRETADGTPPSAFDVRCSVFDVQSSGKGSSP